MNKYVKGPDLISDMAAEDFSLANSSEKLTWKRNRGRRGFFMMDSRKTSKFAIKDKFFRNYSASSGSANEARTCKLSIATTMSARRGEIPVVATLDKSGKLIVDRRKSGRGQHHARPKSVQAGIRNKRRESNVPGGTVSDPLNLQVEDLPETPQVPEPDPKRYDRPANNFIPTNNRDPLGLTNEDDTVPLCTQYDPSGPKRKRSRGRKRDPSISTDTANMFGQLTGSEAAENTTASNPTSASHMTVSFDHTEVTSQPDSSVISSCEPTQSDAVGVAMEQDLQSSKVTEVSDPAKTTSSISVSCDGKVRSTNDVTASDIEVSSEPATHSSTGHTCAKPGTSGISFPLKIVQPSKDRSELHADRLSGTESQARDQRHKVHNRIQKYPVVKSPMDVKEKREVPKGRKSLMEALRIDRIDEEDLERLAQEHKKQQRDSRRKRFPNWKSPVEEQALFAGQSALEPLKVDTDSAGNPVVQGQLSRTLASIVSPKFQPHSGPVRKRRRTISDCSADSGAGAIKALTFRRSSSPDVGRNSTPSPKKRRLSCGSWSGKAKKKAEQVKTAPAVKFAKNPVFKNGNYYRYYGYRLPELEPDYRLSYFRMEWFEGKDVLDIGCNSGHVTLAIAQHFHPQKIVGMDIDPNLIRVARQNIKSYQTMANRTEMKKYPVSMAEYGPIEPLPALTNTSNYFPKNIMFMQGNYVLDRDEQLNYVKQEYDTILALSVTKWVHLNTGDEGLKRMFARIFQQLRPGGRLLLEPQAWVSYRRRKKLTETIYNNYNNIRLKPEHFSDYLLNQVGFCKREVIGVPTHPSKGFQRQLLLFTKFSDQSYTPPNLISPYPSGPPPPVYTIAERFANLAGYSSTPSLDTPGLNTPMLQQPPGLQPGEVSCPFVQDGSCSSASLCSTCMSRASTGPHESDSDYAGYSMQGRPFHRRSSDESPGCSQNRYAIPDTPSPPSNPVYNPPGLNPIYFPQVERTPVYDPELQFSPIYMDQVNGEAVYPLPLNGSPGYASQHQSSPDPDNDPQPNSSPDSPRFNGISSPAYDGSPAVVPPEMGEAGNVELAMDAEEPPLPQVHVPSNGQVAAVPFVNGHMEPENDPGDLLGGQWQGQWAQQQHQGGGGVGQEGEWPSPQGQEWPQPAGQLEPSSPLRSGHVSSEEMTQDKSQPAVVDNSPPVVQGSCDRDSASQVVRDNSRLNQVTAEGSVVHDSQSQDSSQTSHDRLQTIGIDPALDRTVPGSSASSQDVLHPATGENLEAQESTEAPATTDDDSPQTQE